MNVSVPTCVGIILDGNRRWAREHNLPQFEGHRVGLEKLRAITKAVQERHIPHLILYMFSTENWERDNTEVVYLMDLFRDFIKKKTDELKQKDLRIRFVGQRERFPIDMQRSMQALEESSAQKEGGTLWCCMSYGGRAEIVAAARAVAVAGEEITEDSLSRHLWTADMPDPDIIIRTSGEQRLSGFLTWQSVYSELFFTATKWPDFSEEEFDRILVEYSVRQRRRGK